MAIDTFFWRTQIQSGMEGSFSYKTRTAQFGDGYKQIVGDGLNPESQSWPITLTGLKSEMLPALDFIRSHVTKSFIWTSPLDEAGLYRVAADSVKYYPLSAQAITINATFERAFAP
ncbi:phage tail protein [Pragia fontium]|uniref:phage tail protein n=1 Tax=Pragia fontium TaxID=82985 RepID=UPI000F6DB94C|nr:phage tail protein [Pragia fontium]VEJ54636.1 Phage-related protein [Pragia fontium]